MAHLGLAKEPACGLIGIVRTVRANLFASPAMLPEVEKLLRVQHHDQKIKAIDKELAGIPVEADDIRDRLVADQKAVEAAKVEMQHT